MPIIVNLDVMMAKRKISGGDLAQQIGITPANLSILKNNKAKAVRVPGLSAGGSLAVCAGGEPERCTITSRRSQNARRA